jgi:DNA-binding NarL/FixJ family response regulator
MTLSALHSHGVSRACAWLFTHCQGSYAMTETQTQPDRTHLSQQEQRVLTFAEHGKTNKQIALELSISESTVSRAMRRAMKKLQVPNVFILATPEVQQRPVPPSDLMARLTPSEREVLLGVLQGFSNLEIAQQRSRAVRTIANQVSKLFLKLGVSSRRTLAARLARISA